MNLNEWLTLMLEEIHRKAREREEALAERARRQPGSKAPAGTRKPRDSGPASPHPEASGRE